MTLRDTEITLNDGTKTTLNDIAGDNLILVVNTASECGFTPQLHQLENLQETYGGRGLTVIGAPSNQFGGQEPLPDEEIQQHYAEDYNVSFPLLSKSDVNGEDADSVFQELTKNADVDGEAGDVKWNFEKFLIDSDGEVVARFRSATTPDDPDVVALLEEKLPE
ncbi:glutathione peroxidase [Corynebacterium lubricantis]|uniref:glutathione peroxidase n=1 Tax=Corynebacterium lubricantis TaxID=541095 RepID=UPI00037F0466|nr:redoxin domain-containing protein [Corynebacterium lubricantis]